MKIAYFIPLIALLIFSQSCKRICENFPEFTTVFDDLDKKDKITYISGVKEIEFIIENVEIVDPEETATILAMDYYCEFEGKYETSSAGKYRLQEKFKFLAYERDWKVYISENDCFYFDMYGDWYDGGIYLKARSIEDTIINGEKYTDLLLVTKDSLSSTESIDYILHQTAIGVVAFHDAKTNEVWIKE